MRIDDRKVNGQIMLEPTDVINLWTILVVGQTAEWIAGSDKKHMEAIKLPASVAGNYIQTALASFNPVQFLVMLQTDTGAKLLPSPAYIYTPGKISIDIGEITPGGMLEIALPSGSITVKGSK